jgi:hypothetical protein
LDIKLNIRYCDKCCQKGIEARRKFLDENNSAYDAAMDFMWFTEECFKTCPYKEMHTKELKE